MRKLILSAILLAVALPTAAFAHGPKWKRHHRQHYYRQPAPIYYAQPAWAPGYGVIPVMYRSRFRPVPAYYYEDYGPVPRGCRRVMLDGYIVDYRPSNFFVVSFGRAW